MSFRSVFKPVKPLDNYSLEIANRKDEGEVAPKLTLFFYDINYMYSQSINQQAVGFEQTVLSESQTKANEEVNNLRRPKVAITLKPTKSNLDEMDKAFRDAVKNAYEHRIISLRDYDEIFTKYENYLKQNGLKAASTDKKNNRSDFSSFRPTGGMVH
ncbi:hypothetical protein [Aquicella lusitana]|uniref:Uncharacterized protein n=1 Tax=Aquicella lusitana TaxID=254246 RepID=A0A370GG93_9COXI|nr:hypothetical protein [Aquicella lusitana]RDI42825.1 hypothetical protein C8D86_11222 [Aquicella lusitana]VVC73068.1 hypothetical protein AQULUS_07990 [Aquicella lusitana]